VVAGPCGASLKRAGSSGEEEGRRKPGDWTAAFRRSDAAVPVLTREHGREGVDRVQMGGLTWPGWSTRGCAARVWKFGPLYI